MCVCQPVHSAFCIRERSKPDTGPNTLRLCLFNHNLGLHENANQKQTGFPGNPVSGAEGGGLKRGRGQERERDERGRYEGRESEPERWVMKKEMGAEESLGETTGHEIL